LLRCGPGALGADAVRRAGLRADIAGDVAMSGTAADTIAVVARLGRPDLVVVGGGDGTVRDVLSALPEDVPLLGIPCGSKMQSGVFARSPEAAGRILGTILADGRLPRLRRAEVADLDEAALREGVIAPRPWGEALVPGLPEVVMAKGRPRTDDAAALAAAAIEAMSALPPDTLVILGPGAGAKAAAQAFGLSLSALGVDAVSGGRLVGTGLSRSALSGLVAAHPGPVRVVLGIIGRQGVLIGRGNREIGPDILWRVGREGLIVLATGDKLATLVPPVLTVDSGDMALDAALAGYVRAITGPGRVTLLRIAGG
jgi:predicted polyphosphate/ATP-dependent NAD kinase